jgi:uncharacterized protein YcnI
VNASRIRLALGGAVVVIAVGELAQPAFAHVEPDPGTVPAASTATITFNLEHGCEESDTVKLEMKLADGVTDATPAPIDGWTSSVADGVITWTGGPQPHDQALPIPVEMTFPNDAGQVLLFPLVQTCEQGEIRWVDPPNPDGSEPEDPAPAITLTAAAAGQTTTTSAAASTTAASTTAASTTAASATTAAPTTAPQADEKSDGTAGVIAIVAVGIVVVVGLGAWLLARRAGPA